MDASTGRVHPWRDSSYGCIQSKTHHLPIVQPGPALRMYLPRCHRQHERHGSLRLRLSFQGDGISWKGPLPWSRYVIVHSRRKIEVAYRIHPKATTCISSLVSSPWSLSVSFSDPYSRVQVLDLAPSCLAHPQLPTRWSRHPLSA